MVRSVYIMYRLRLLGALAVDIDLIPKRPRAR